MDDLENASGKVEIKRDEKGRILPGQQSLNPAGKPLGSVSIMAKIRAKFRDNTEKFDEYVDEVLEDPGLRKEIIQQLDGRPKESVELNVTLPDTLIGLIKYGTAHKEGDN